MRPHRYQAYDEKWLQLCRMETQMAGTFDARAHERERRKTILREWETRRLERGIRWANIARTLSIIERENLFYLTNLNNSCELSIIHSLGRGLKYFLKKLIINCQLMDLGNLNRYHILHSIWFLGSFRQPSNDTPNLYISTPALHLHCSKLLFIAVSTAGQISAVLVGPAPSF